CGFGGTFAVKNPDTSAAMLADKMHHVLSTRAEVCSASDSSCLLHIGGGLSRLRAGVRTVHLAEILASTRTEQPEVPPRGATPSPWAGRPRRRGWGTCAGGGRSRRRPGRPLATPSCGATWPTATGTIRPKRAQAVGEVPDGAELRAAGAALKDQVVATLDAYLVQLEEQVTARGG